MRRPPSVKLNVLQLEDRSTPAKFTVSLLSPSDGDEGDTAATHSGSLALNPAVTVTAADATAAVKAAFSGTINVTIGGSSTGYTFSSSANSTGDPFRIDLEGEQAVISLEDMAGLSGCDWDYNDRYWAMMVRETGPEEVVHTSTEQWTNYDWTAAVTVTVTANKPGFEGLYHWQYHLNNISVSPYPGDPGVGLFAIRALEPGGIDNLWSSTGWQGDVGLLSLDPQLVSWQAPSVGGRVLPGQSADFSFTTPVCAIADSGGLAYDQTFADGVEGPTKGPDIMIRSVTWWSFNAAGTLTTNRIPDGPMMPGGGKRIFADKLRPSDAAADSGDQVYVRVELSHEATQNTNVFGHLFDVDDPSPADAIIDDEKDPTDNKGATLYIGDHLITVPTGRKSERLKLKVSTKPGDNFRFAATIDNNVILGNTVKIKEQGQGANTTYGDGEAAGIYFGGGRGAAVSNQNAKTVKSELLTVWRRLHVERDHMKAPAANYPYPADDTAVSGDSLPDPSIALLSTNIMPAYVQVFDDLGSLNTKKLLDWKNNLATDNEAQLQDAGDATRDVDSELDFWVVHIIGAYEGEEATDFDPLANAATPEGALVGITINPKDGQNYRSGSVFIFHETSRDLVANWNTVYPLAPAVPTLYDYIPRNVLHEVLHRFGLVHKPGHVAIPPNPGDEGCMVPSINRDASKLDKHKLTTGQLNAVRSVDRP